MWAERILDYYKKGYYTKEQVQQLVPVFITQKECEEILNTPVD